jgi:hypothetical protein
MNGLRKTERDQTEVSGCLFMHVCMTLRERWTGRLLIRQTRLVCGRIVPTVSPLPPERM